MWLNTHSMAASALLLPVASAAPTNKHTAPNRGTHRTWTQQTQSTPSNYLLKLSILCCHHNRQSAMMNTKATKTTLIAGGRTVSGLDNATHSHDPSQPSTCDILLWSCLHRQHSERLVPCTPHAHPRNTKGATPTRFCHPPRGYSPKQHTAATHLLACCRFQRSPWTPAAPRSWHQALAALLLLLLLLPPRGLLLLPPRQLAPLAAAAPPLLVPCCAGLPGRAAQAWAPPPPASWVSSPLTKQGKRDRVQRGVGVFSVCFLCVELSWAYMQ